MTNLDDDVDRETLQKEAERLLKEKLRRLQQKSSAAVNQHLNVFRRIRTRSSDTGSSSEGSRAGKEKVV